MRFLLCATLLFTATPAAADHAIAMHGAPKYGPDFRHFAYTEPDAPDGGTLRLGVNGSFDNVNPFALRGRAAYGANPASGQLYLYDSLMARSQDEPFTLYGLIAEDVSVTPDFSSVTFKLNPAARFHDGKTITSADVLFSWQTFRDHGRPNQRTYYGKVTRAEAPDDATVTFHFKTNARGTYDRELPLIMGMMQVVPEYAWKQSDLTAPTLTPLLGSGPYRIKSLDPGRSIVWERVPDYWARDLPSQRGLYHFDRIQIDYYRNDQASLQAFKAGAYDVRREVNPALWATSYDGPNRTGGAYRLEELPHQRSELRAFAINQRKPLFQDRALRRAISLAFDFGWMNRVLFYGQYKRGDSYFTNGPLAATAAPDAMERELLEPFRAALPQELFTSPFTLDDGRGFAARQRGLQRDLQRAGYMIRDGQLLTPSGAPVKFTITLDDPVYEKVALSLAHNLGELGMQVAVRTMDSAQFQMRLTNFDYDLTLVRWVNSQSPGNEQAIYWGSAAEAQPGSRNYAGIQSPAVDDLITRITAAPNRPALETAVHALDRVLQWGYYIVPLYYLPTDHVALAADLRHPALTPLYGYVLESWWREAGLTKGK